MNKKIALMAITGILALASCSQTPTDTTAPTVTFSATPNPVNSGATVTLSGTATDNASGTGVKSVAIVSSNGGPTCTATVSSTGAFSCTVTAPSVTSSTTYNYSATATDNGGNTSNAVTSSVTVNPVGSEVTTSVLTVDLVNVTTAPITIYDANNAIAAGYSNAFVTDGQTITLPRGTYRVVAGTVNNYTTPAATNVDLSNGNATATLTYTGIGTGTTTKTGAFYVNADGDAVYFSQNPTQTKADIAAGKFRFSSWMENKAGGITVSNTDGVTNITGAATDAEREEYAPTDTQNIVGAYMEYNDNGTWRPVVNAEVRMDITEQRGGVRFAAADEGGLDSGTAQPLNLKLKPQYINANATSTASFTNSRTGENAAFPASPRYPTYNVTGVYTPNTDGFTWAALNHDPAYTTTDGGIAAYARVRSVGYINGMEIDKQWLNKNFVATANLEVIKELVVLDRNQNDTVVGIAADNTVYEPGQEIGVRIRVINRGAAPADDIALTDALTSGPAAAYAIGFSPALQTYAANQGWVITNSGDDGFTANHAEPLAPGATTSIVFIATGVQDNLYCDTATINSYVNGTGLLAPIYSDTDTANINQNGLATNADQACFTIKGVPALTIQKDLVDTRGTATVDDDVLLPDGTQVARNTNVRVRVTVRNNGSGTADGIVVTDALTTGNAAVQSISLIGSPDGGSNSATLVGNDGFTWNVGSLPAGGVARYDFNAQASADGQYCDTATITSTNVTPAVTSDSACYNVATAQLEISKTNNPRTVRAGSTYTSTIIVKNTGTLSANNVTVRDLIGRLTTNPNVQLDFTTGRYVLGVIEPATGELRPIGAERGVTTADMAGVVTVDPNETARTIGDIAADGTDTGVTIPAGGYLAFNVVTTVPTGTGPGTYCDVATFTSSNAVYTTNRAEACVTIESFLAIQAGLDDANDNIPLGGTTLFTATAFNEVESTENAINNAFTFNVGTPADGTGAINVTGIQVWYDPTAVDVGTGQVVYVPGPSTANQDIVNITATSTISAVSSTGTFTVTPNGQAIVPGGAIFVTFTGGATEVGNYQSNFSWTTTGAISGTTKTDGGTEDTTFITP